MSVPGSARQDELTPEVKMFTVDEFLLNELVPCNNSARSWSVWTGIMSFGWVLRPPLLLARFMHFCWAVGFHRLQPWFRSNSFPSPHR
ncbi:protein of unknown function [Cyanobium sp. NIES-981]|nr:protein of unknown function [Cyanobium sp. NIES-981]